MWCGVKLGQSKCWDDTNSEAHSHRKSWGYEHFKILHIFWGARVGIISLNGCLWKAYLNLKGQERQLTCELCTESIIHLSLCWVFVATHRPSLAAVSGGLPFIAVHGLLCSSFSNCGAQAPGTPASVVVARRLSCPNGMWNLPRPGIEPMSPALAGEFLSTFLATREA